MRIALVAVVVFGWSAGVTAQSSMSRWTGFNPFPTIGVPSSLPLPSIGLPLPQIGLPLPQIGLPFPQIGVPRVPQPRDPALGFGVDRQRFRSGQGQRAGQRGRGRNEGALIYFVPVSAWPSYTDVPSPPVAPVEREEQKPRAGRLRLALQRGVVAQIYIDGYYVGMLDDFGSELTLDAGPHHVELRADGYESLEVDVQVPAGRPISYKGALKPVDPAPAPVPQAPQSANVLPPAPATIYMIPGCYVGNVPPHDAGLPVGCDERRAITFQPRP